MRVIQLQIPVRHRETVREILGAKDIDHIITDATNDGNEVIVVQFPVPRQAVEAVLAEFRDAGIDVDDSYRVNLNAEIARAENMERSVERLIRGTGDYIAREELRERAREMTPGTVTYYLMTMLGTVVATCGLLLNSAAVVVGSMVIAPQLGSALTASVGIAVNDRDMIARGLSFQVAGLGLGLLGSVAFAALLRWTMVVPPVIDIATLAQVGSRTSPGLLSVTIGLAAGTGAAFSLATHDTPSGPLVGMMVSAALLPAAATTGIGVAWGLPHVVVGSLVLLVVNVVCINLTGPLVFWALGYRPAGWDDRAARTPRSLVRYYPSLLTVSLLVASMTGASVVVGHQVSFEQTATSSVADVLERERFDGVEVRDISTEYATTGLTGEPQTVVIVVSRSTNESYPELGTIVQREITADTGYSVTVETEYEAHNRTVANDPEPGRNASGGSDEAGTGDRRRGGPGRVPDHRRHADVRRAAAPAGGSARSARPP